MITDNSEVSIGGTSGTKLIIPPSQPFLHATLQISVSVNVTCFLVPPGVWLGH